MYEESGLTAADSDLFVAPDETSPEYLCVAAERLRLVESAIGNLRSRHLRLVQMRYGRGMTFIEIAVAFGVVESAVHAMHGRILCALRETFERQGIKSLSDIL